MPTKNQKSSKIIRSKRKPNNTDEKQELAINDVVISSSHPRKQEKEISFDEEPKADPDAKLTKKASQYFV